MSGHWVHPLDEMVEDIQRNGRSMAIFRKGEPVAVMCSWAEWCEMSDDLRRLSAEDGAK